MGRRSLMVGLAVFVLAVVGLAMAILFPSQRNVALFALAHPKFVTELPRQTDALSDYLEANFDAHRFEQIGVSSAAWNAESQANAVEHAWSSAVITYRFGEATARELGDVDEWIEQTFARDITEGNGPQFDIMVDQCNNAIGRAIGRAARRAGVPLGRLDGRVLAALKRGELCGVWGEQSQTDESANSLRVPHVTLDETPQSFVDAEDLGFASALGGQKP